MSSDSGANSTFAQSGGGAVDRPSPPQPMPGLWTSGSRSLGYAVRSASYAFSAFTSAVFWVRIVRISSLVGSRRDSQTCSPYTAVSSSRT